MEKYFSIQSVAKVTALPASTIRYYEAEGLIKNIERNSASVRQFTQEDIAWISFLAKLKQMEMPLTMMKQYAQLREQGDSTIQKRIDLLEIHRQSMQEKIHSLEKNIGLLDEKIEIYHEMKRTKQ